MEYNVVSISGKEFHKFFDDERFLENAMRQSSDYLFRYEKTGECALITFLLETDDDSSYPALFTCAKQPNDNDDGYHFEIAVFMPLYKRPEDDKGQYETILFHVDEEVVNGVSGLGVDIDIPSDSKIWERFGVSHFRDLPPLIIAKITQKAAPLICLFAHVQRQALKSQRKIEKLYKSSAKCTVKQGEYKESKSVIPLSGTLKLSVREMIESNAPREIIRRCEAWSVRGHYRHYKNGKVVFIAPYIKGKGRVKPKEYKV